MEGVMFLKLIFKNSIFALTVFSLVSFGHIAWADTELGKLYYEAGNFERVFKEFNESAKKGEAEAQYNLGVMYANGEGLPENNAEAVKLWLLAADQGYARAQYNLGVMYANGEGVPENDAEAVKWYRLAADQGVANAQFNLGFKNEEFLQGFEAYKIRDFEKAFQFLSKAAENGNPVAQILLGSMYFNGDGVEKNSVLAYKWLTLGIYRWEPETPDYINMIYALLEVSLSSEKMKESENLVNQWLKAHNEKYLEKEFVSTDDISQDDLERNFQIFLKEAETGDSMTQYLVGMAYESGTGTEQSFEKAFEWYNKAARQGFDLSQYKLGVMYANGEGVPRNDVLSFMWFNLAAAQGHERASENKKILRERMTTDQIAEAERLIQEWLEEHQ